MPRISVILTSFNHEKYIAAAIESVLNQTFTDFELIIADDCSTDSSWEIIQQYNDARIISIRPETKFNTMQPVYHMLPLCKGEYIAIHNSDDIWTPRKLEKQIAYLDAHPLIAACFTWVHYIDEEGKIFIPENDYHAGALFNQLNKSRYEWLREFFLNGNKLCHPSVLIRRQAYIDYKLFVMGLGRIADFVRWIRLCKNKDIHIIQEPLVHYRWINRDNANLSSESNLARIQNSAELFFLREEYMNLSEEEIIKIFPEVDIYKRKEGFVAQYAFAQICLNCNQPWRILLGMEILLKLLNDPKKSKQIEDIYNFTSLDFFKITKQRDVFSVFMPERDMKCSVYLNCGKGFCQSSKISLSMYLHKNGVFKFSFDLSEYERVIAMRLVPQEGYLCKIKIYDLIIDGDKRTLYPLNAHCSKEMFDYFLTPNPIYHIDGGGRHVEISGEWHRINDALQIEGLLRSKDNRKKILYGAGLVGKQALDYYGKDEVYAFSDMNKYGEMYMSIPILKPKELINLQTEYEIVICVKEYESAVTHLNSIGVDNCTIFYQIDTIGLGVE